MNLIFKAFVISFVLATWSAYAENKHQKHDSQKYPSHQSLLKIESPWVPVAPPNAKVHAGYMVLKNTTNVKQVIESVSSPQYRKCEIHRTKIENGIATMEHLPHLIVPPKGTLKLAPGGLHLMLMGPKRAFLENDKVTILFHLKNEISIKSIANFKKRFRNTHKNHSH